MNALGTYQENWSVATIKDIEVFVTCYHMSTFNFGGNRVWKLSLVD